MYNKQEYLLLSKLRKDNLIQIFQENNAIIAGGAIRAVFANETISDYDVYFRNHEQIYKFCNQLKEVGMELVYQTDVATTFKRKDDGLTVQVITMSDIVGLSPKEIIDLFDYSVCMGAYDFNSNSFILGDTFLEHLAQRELFYNTNGKYPIASLFRLRKYIRKGYTISGVEVVKLALSVNNLDIRSYTQLKKQLEGIDTYFLKELTDKLLTSEYAEKEYDFTAFLNLVDQVYNEKLDDLFVDGL